MCRRIFGKRKKRKNLDCVDLVGHFGCVNAVEFSPDGTKIASGGDDKRLMVSFYAKYISFIKYNSFYSFGASTIEFRVRKNSLALTRPTFSASTFLPTAQRYFPAETTSA